MKKIILLFVIILLLNSLFASPEVWISMGLSSGRDYASDTLRKELLNTNVYNKGNENSEFYINYLGPIVGFTLFPSDAFRVGVDFGASTNFTIGVCDSGSVGSTFRRFDFREDFKLGLAYYQMFGATVGIYSSLGFDMSFYRLGLDPKKNQTTLPAFLTFSQYSLYADFGLLQKFNNWFFKFGFSYNKNLFNKENSGWSLGVSASGGYIF